MCQFFSAVLTKGHKVHALFGVNSHEDIIEILDLRERTVRGEPALVRCELEPPSSITLDFERWKFKCNQDILPSWYDETIARDAMVRYLQNAPTLTGEVGIVDGNYYFSTAKVWLMIGRSSILYMLPGAEVKEMHDYSYIGRMSSARVGLMYGSSCVGVMRGWSLIDCVSASAQVSAMADDSRIGTMIRKTSVGMMCQHAHIDIMTDDSSVHHLGDEADVQTMKGQSVIDLVSSQARIGMMEQHSIVKEFCDDATIELMCGHSQVLDMYGKAKVREVRDFAVVRSERKAA